MDNKEEKEAPVLESKSMLALVFGVFWIAMPVIMAFWGNSIKPTITMLVVNKKPSDEAYVSALGLGTTIMNVFVR